MKHFCSFFPDAFFGVYLKNYCKRHDEGYAEVRALRLLKDKEFREEIEQDNTKGVAKFLAPTLYRVVRVLGRLFV